MAIVVNLILWLCFTVSGAAALALEMLWMRSAGLVLGQTAVTTATVLACYFGGLALGAGAARGVAQRPAIVYAVLEIGVAAGALWSVGLFHALASDTVQRWLAAGTSGRVLAVATAVLPATVCLGATLPAIGQALAGGSVGTRGSLLYALNTLGGAAGIAAAGFGLPAIVGVNATYGIAAATSAAAGSVALAVGRQLPSPRFSIAGHVAPSTVPRGRLRTVAAGTGGLGLALEVLWTRLFAQVLHNSVYSFSAIALVFLIALAIGAAIAAVLVRRLPPTTVAATALGCAAISTVAGAWLFARATDGLGYVGMQFGLPEYVLRIVALAAVTAGPAAVASGAVMAALWAAWGGHEGAARPLGELSAANTLGGIAGAVAAGFVAIPLLGIGVSLLAVAVAYLIFADVVAGATHRLKPIAYAALLAIVIGNPMRIPLVNLRPEKESLRAMLEGPSGIVSVVDSGDDLQLRLDNYYVLGGSAAATNERRLGLLPLLLHAAPHHAAFIGLATGITASAGPALGLDKTTVIEVVPEVARAARAYFSRWNARLLERPGVALVLDDGRRYLGASRERYDVIISDLFVPWHAGAGNLYSREMYQTVRQHLAAGGLFCQWLPLYQLTREEFDMIAHTFLSIFPRVSLWRADFYPNRPVVALVGQLDAQTIDLDRFSQRADRLPEWARDPLLATPRGLVMLYAGDLSAAADLFARAPLNTDDRPRLEFLAPRLTRMNAAGDKDWFTGEALAKFYDTLDGRMAQSTTPFVPNSGFLIAARRAGTALYKYALAAADHDDALARQWQTEVSDLVPEVIASVQATESLTDLADRRRSLADLRAQQQDVRRKLDALEHQLDQLSSTGRAAR